MDHRAFVYAYATASDRTIAAAKLLAERFGLDATALENTWHRDNEVRQLNEQTALADFLEALVGAVPVKKAKKADGNSDQL